MQKLKFVEMMLTKSLGMMEIQINITNEQILAKQVELQAIYDAKQYQRDRATIGRKRVVILMLEIN